MLDGTTCNGMQPMISNCAQDGLKMFGHILLGAQSFFGFNKQKGLLFSLDQPLTHGVLSHLNDGFFVGLLRDWQRVEEIPPFPFY